eukprot:scaffold1541_cov256-Pinguiococcus_pyrenoidosus.AAC.14
MVSSIGQAQQHAVHGVQASLQAPSLVVRAQVVLYQQAHVRWLRDVACHERHRDYEVALHVLDAVEDALGLAGGDVQSVRGAAGEIEIAKEHIEAGGCHHDAVQVVGVVDAASDLEGSFEGRQPGNALAFLDREDVSPPLLLELVAQMLQQFHKLAPLDGVAAVHVVQVHDVLDVLVGLRQSQAVKHLEQLVTVDLSRAVFVVLFEQILRLHEQRGCDVFRRLRLLHEHLQLYVLDVARRVRDAKVVQLQRIVHGEEPDDLAGNGVVVGLAEVERWVLPALLRRLEWPPIFATWVVDIEPARVVLGLDAAGVAKAGEQRQRLRPDPPDGVLAHVQYLQYFVGLGGGSEDEGCARADAVARNVEPTQGTVRVQRVRHRLSSVGAEGVVREIQLLQRSIESESGAQRHRRGQPNEVPADAELSQAAVAAEPRRQGFGAGHRLGSNHVQELRLADEVAGQVEAAEMQVCAQVVEKDGELVIIHVGVGQAQIADGTGWPLDDRQEGGVGEAVVPHVEALQEWHLREAPGQRLSELVAKAAVAQVQRQNLPEAVVGVGRPAIR